MTALLILFAMIDSQVVAAVLPEISDSLETSPTVLASSVTVYAISAASVAFGLAWRRRIQHPGQWLPLSGVLFVGASALTALAPNVVFFMAGRAVAGFGGGMISALAIAALANASSYAKRGSQMSWVAISYFLAPVVGVPLGSYLTGQIGWRAVFVIVALLVALATAAVYLVPLAGTDSPDSSEPNDQAGKSFSSAFKHIWRLSNQTRSTRMGLLSAFFVSGGLVGFTTYLATWVHTAFGAQASDISFVYGLAGMGAVVGGAAGGGIADRFGKRRVAVSASLAMAVFLFMVPGFTWGPSLFVIIALTAIFAAVRVAPLQALVTEVVAPNERSTYVALRNASSQIGIASTVALCAPLFDRYGLFGVATLCALLTLGAWGSIRFMDDPHIKAKTRDRPMRTRLMAVAGRIAVTVVLVVTLLLPWLLSFLVTKAGTRPDERNRPDTPASYGARYEDVRFDSVDHISLSGWWLPNDARAVTIVVTHGLFRSRYETLERSVDLWKLGYNVLVYDLRRHGKSDGEFCSLGYNERLDVEGAIEYARTRAPRNKVVLMGISMGAAATLLAAAETPDISAVIVDSSFLSLRHTVWHHLRLGRIPPVPFAPILVTITSWRLGYSADDFDVLAAVRKIQEPIMFIGGSGDVRMPIDTVLDPLHDAATNPAKARFVVPSATHGHAYASDPQAYIASVSRFLQDQGI